MEVDRDKTGREAKLGGIRVLRTNSSAPAARTARRHKNLWRAERLFRAAKSLLRTPGRRIASATPRYKEPLCRREDRKVESERREDGGDFVERQPAADRPAGLSLADEKSGL